MVPIPTVKLFEGAKSTKAHPIGPSYNFCDHIGNVKNVYIFNKMELSKCN